jgi:hypothetical protein
VTSPLAAMATLTVRGSAASVLDENQNLYAERMSGDPEPWPWPWRPTAAWDAGIPGGRTYRALALNGYLHWR